MYAHLAHYLCWCACSRVLTLASEEHIFFCCCPHWWHHYHVLLPQVPQIPLPPYCPPACSSCSQSHRLSPFLSKTNHASLLVPHGLALCRAMLLCEWWILICDKILKVNKARQMNATHRLQKMGFLGTRGRFLKGESWSGGNFWRLSFLLHNHP